jgi:hypothetical protein
VTLGTAPPDVSLTVPVIVPVPEVCACEDGGARETVNRVAAAKDRRRVDDRDFMVLLAPDKVTAN